MSTASKIEWTRGDDGAAGATWNPVTGCVEVSEGCDLCYARVFAERWRGVPGHPFEQGFDVRLWPDRLGLPLTWRKPKRVFVNSMSDLWHDEVPDDFVAAVWATMYWTSPLGRSGHWKPRHTYQLLTKRPGRMRSWVQRWSDREQRAAWIASAARKGWCNWEDEEAASDMPAILPNVWLGVSVESQRWAQVRLPQLAQTPAVVRFVSCEPLLGELDLRPWLDSGLQWVIGGGESGAKARPMSPGWARSLRDQCTVADVPFFFKQWGHFAPIGPVFDAAGDELYDENDLALTTSSGCAVNPDGSRPVEWTARGLVTTGRFEPGAWWMARVGKGQAGNELDGRTWNAFPVPLAKAGVAGG